MQELKITVQFKVKHSPNIEKHLAQVLSNYFLAKGVQFDGDNLTITV